MSINSADKKPEKYVGPDGKAKIRMVPVDREVVKNEGGMKRIATNQSDKNADPKDKGLKTFKKLRASYESFEPHMMYDPETGKGYKADKKADHLRMKKMGYTHDKPEVKEVSEAEDPKMYCKDCGCEAGNPDPDCMCENDCNNLKPNQLTADRSSCGSVNESINEISPELQKSYYKKAMKQYKQSIDKKQVGGYSGVAKQATADKHMKRFMKRHKGIGSAIKRDDPNHFFQGSDTKRNSMTGKPAPYQNESVNEVLDTPGAMDRYHNKAKAQSDRARNSATAKIVRGNKDISKEKDIIRKREKGMDMATNVRAKQFRKAVTGKPYGESVEEDMNPYLKHSTDKLKNKHASFSRQIGDLQTKKLKGAKNPSIDQEIAKYQQKLRHVKNAMKSEATIPDGQTAMTKKPAISANDADKLSKIRKMLDKEKNK